MPKLRIRLKPAVDQQVGQIDTLAAASIALESKISEAKTKKDMLKARISAAKAQEQLQTTVGRLGTSSDDSASSGWRKSFNAGSSCSISSRIAEVI